MKSNDNTTSIWGASTVAMSSSVHCAIPVPEFVKLFDNEASTIAPTCGQEIFTSEGLITESGGTAFERSAGNGISSSNYVPQDGGIGEHVNTYIACRDNEHGTEYMSGGISCAECDPEDGGDEEDMTLAGGTLVVESRSSGGTPNQIGNDEPSNDGDKESPLVNGTLVLENSTADNTEIDHCGDNNDNEKSPSIVAGVGEELGGMKFHKHDTVNLNTCHVSSEINAEGDHNLAAIGHPPPSCGGTASCRSNNDHDNILNEGPEEILATPLGGNMPSSHCRSVLTPVIGVLDTPSPLRTPAYLRSIVAIPPSQEDVMVMSEPAAKRRACIPEADFVSATPSSIHIDESMVRNRSSPLLPLYYSSQQSATVVTDSEVEPSPSLSSNSMQKRKSMSSFDHYSRSAAAASNNIDSSTSLLVRKVVEDHHPPTVSSGEDNNNHKEVLQESSTPMGDVFCVKRRTAIKNSCTTTSTDIGAMVDYDGDLGYTQQQEITPMTTRRYNWNFQPSCSDTNSNGATFMYNVPGGLSQTPPPKTHQDRTCGLKKLSLETVTATTQCVNESVLQTSSSNPDHLTSTISTSNACTWRSGTKPVSVGSSGSTLPCPSTAALLPSSLPAISTSFIHEATPRSSKQRLSLSTTQGLFTAASGRKLNVSEDALKKAQKMFATGSPPLVVTPSDTPVHSSSSLSSTTTSLAKSREGRIGQGPAPQRNHAMSSKQMLGRRDSSSYVDLKSGGMGKGGDLRCVANGGMNRVSGKQQWQRTGFSTGDGKVLFVSDEALARVESNGMGAVKQVSPLLQSRGGTVGSSKSVVGGCSSTRTAPSHAGIQPAAAIADSHSTTPSFSSPSSSFTLVQPLLSVRLNDLGPPKTRTVTSAVSQGVSRVVALLSAATALKLRFSVSTGTPCCYNPDSLCDQVSPPILSSCPAHDGQLSTLDTLYNGLLNTGADRKLLTRAWVRNHARWIIWKLACLERSWPKIFSGRLLNLDETIRRLRKRYFLELERVRPKGWPLVRSIMQGDASFSMPMTLCASQVLPGTPITKKWQCEGQDSTDEGVVVELTDGWHAIRAKLDSILSHYSRQGQIKVGMKLCVLPIAFDGHLADPLEVDQEATCQGDDIVDLPREGLRLKLCCNSTRRAKWSAPLGPLKGVRGLPPLCVPLCSVNPLGGLVTAVKVVVLRRYAPQYVDYASGTTTAVRVLSEEEMHGIQDARQDAATIRLEGKEEEIMQKVLSSPANSALPGGHHKEILRRLKEEIISHERSSFLRPHPFIAVSLGCPCEACLGGKRLQRSTELRVWEPSADVTEQLEPGRVVLLKRVDVPRHVNTSSGISLHLATSRNTIIDFPQKEFIQSFIPSPPVTCAYLGGIAARFLFWGVDDEDTPNDKPPGGDVDFVGALVGAYVLEATSASSSGDFATREHHVFFIDASNQVICLKRHVAREVFTHCRVLSGCRGSCWSVCDVHVVSTGLPYGRTSYDEANSILQASWSNHTDVTCTSRTPLSPAQKQMQHLLRELKQWYNTDSGRGALREAAERVELSLKGSGLILMSSSS